MRLLQCSGNSEFSLTTFGNDEAIPPYAILSHTWLEDGEEPTFEDLVNKTGKEKPGFEKIRFCAEQAAQDGLRYFWIDTCCINKANKAELSQAIKSMFLWYRNAARCYVYLLDVSTAKQKGNGDASEWEPAFRGSRWFTRGWTLQELLAPCSVEFFSCQRKRLGDRDSLRQQIHEITAIPKSALQRALLSRFSVNERLSWTIHRQTKLEEDKAYSLLGIFGVDIPPMYGEGITIALGRLQKEIDKLEECMQDLHITDPLADKARIEETKGGLLEDSYHWILENADFQQWMISESQLLWIKGDPGKGKTMLVCGIINELSKTVAKTALLSYFFCQATDTRINSATAVLRGLIYLLVYQQPSLVAHVRKKYDGTKTKLFQGPNSWFALYEIFMDIVQDSSRKSLCLIVDALDECVVDLRRLLDLIVQTSSTSSRVKWIISSRNWPDIEERLTRAGDKISISLELNAELVSAAVSSYIRHKVSRLAQDKKYGDETKRAVLDYLHANANNTFLWAALVCQNLDSMSRFNVVTKLKVFPPGLNSLYEHMIQRINNSDDSDLCRRVLAIITIVYRPITVQELTSLVEDLDGIAEDLESVREVISLCGSLLTIRDGIIYFVHQSVKDFLLNEAVHVVFPSGSEAIHYTVFSRSLLSMSKTLRRDIYGLGALGYPIGQVQQPEPDPLVASRYSCIYWIDHLCNCDFDSVPNARQSLQEGGTIDVFLSTRYLYWLEALSLCGCLSRGVMLIANLASLIKDRIDTFALNKLVYDAHRFIMYHKVAIESFPLQTYSSALLFSPTRSLIRRLFKQEAPTWVTILPSIQDDWDACLQTFEGHRGKVNSVLFSHDSKQIISTSFFEVKIWDAISGQCLQTLDIPGFIDSIAFSHDSKQVAAVLSDGRVFVWNVINGKCLFTLEWPASTGSQRWAWGSISFSHNSAQLVSTYNSKLAVWNVRNGKCTRILKGHRARIMTVSFSCDSKRLASASQDGSFKIWDADSGKCLKTHWFSYPAESVAFFKDLSRIISSSGHRIAIYDGKDGKCLQAFNNTATSLALSHDSMQFATGSLSGRVDIWNVNSGMCLQDFKGHNDCVNSVSFSHNATHLASASDDGTIKTWDLGQAQISPRYDDNKPSSFTSMALSHDSTQLALARHDAILEVWDVRNGKCLHKIESHRESVLPFAFSFDSTQLASASDDGTVKLWNLGTGECLQTFNGHHNRVISIAFSPCTKTLASASEDSSCKVWDIDTGECLKTFEDCYMRAYHAGNSIAFSHESTQLAATSDDFIVKVWDISSGECIQVFKHPESHHESGNGKIASIAFSKRLASATIMHVARIWDVKNGQCLHTFQTAKMILQMCFDITGSYLHTNNGTIDIHASSPVTDRTQTDMRLPWAQYRGLAITRLWITYDSENLVWLPSDFRLNHGATDVAEKTIGIMDDSGEVRIYDFDLDQLSQGISH